MIQSMKEVNEFCVVVRLALYASGGADFHLHLLLDFFIRLIGFIGSNDAGLDCNCLLSHVKRAKQKIEICLNIYKIKVFRIYTEEKILGKKKTVISEPSRGLFSAK